MSPILIGLGGTATGLGIIVTGVLMALWRRHAATPTKPKPSQPTIATFANKGDEEDGNPDLIPTSELTNHLDGDYQCGMRRKLKEGAIPSLMLPQRNKSNVVSKEAGDPKIDVNENENSSATMNLTPSTAEFLPMAFRNWVRKSTGSSSCRRSSLLEAAESSDSNFPSTPKSRRGEFLRTQVFFVKPEDNVNGGRVETNEKNNTVPGPSSEHVEAVGPNKKLEDTGKSFKSRPCKRLVWKREDLDESTRTMYEHILEAKKERDKYRTKSLRYSFGHSL